MTLVRFSVYCSCFFDGVKGNVGNICFTTAPLIIILLLNIVLYTLTWSKINRTTKQLSSVLGQNLRSKKTTLGTARSLSLFVAAFMVQWSIAGVYGAWGLFAEVPVFIFHTVTIFSNIGGLLNFIVYIILHWKHRYGMRRNSSTIRHQTIQGQRMRPTANCSGEATLSSNALYCITTVL